MRRPLSIMSWNLYLGAEVQPLIGAPPDEVPERWRKVWNTVQRTDFASRCRTMAMQIAGNSPDVLLLQEAYRWTVVHRRPGMSPTFAVVHDFVPELIGALAALGLPYVAVSRAPGVFLELPTANGPDVRMEDSVAILLRADSEALMGWKRPQRGSFATTLEVQVNGEPFRIARGWASVDVALHEGPVRLVNTHLEYFGEGIKPGQLQELLDGPLAGTMPAVLGGDFNARPDDPVATKLAAAGFVDAWRGPGAGHSSSQDELLDNETSKLYERIDWILTRGPLRASAARLVAHRPQDRTPGGLWPSDHAAVLTTVQWSEAEALPTGTAPRRRTSSYDLELLERDLAQASSAQVAGADPSSPAARTRFVVRARAGYSAAQVRGALHRVSERFGLAPLLDPEVFDPALLTDAQRRSWVATLAVDPADLSRDPRDVAMAIFEEGAFERVDLDVDPRRAGPPREADEGPDGLSGGGGDEPPPARKEWALEQLRVPEAWSVLPGRGRGIRIGHLDTGYAPHREWVETPLAVDRGYNFVSGTSDPLDPLWTGPFLHPGHGTATASVIVGATGACGVAPGAELVPIRCITSVIVGGIAGGETELTRGVQWALQNGCRVISMSLGGYLMMWDLWSACVEAIKKNVIIVAASGNKFWFLTDATVFPAKFDELIAVSATAPDAQPWSSACCTPWWRNHFSPPASRLVHGGHVDITAPGHNVWRALREPGDGGAADRWGYSSGTSYATAHLAGIAALWLAKHYPDGFTEATGCAQRMFLSELQRTCTPGGGNGWHGPGIANVERLLKESPHGRTPVTRSMGHAP